MTFKIGDMVRIVSGKSYINGVECAESDIGKSGTITGSIPTCWSPDGRIWEVRLADGKTLWSVTACLRLIPGDSEGRQLVRWDQCHWSPSRSLVEA